jgi:hypothetical protein
MTSIYDEIPKLLLCAYCRGELPDEDKHSSMKLKLSDNIEIKVSVRVQLLDGVTSCTWSLPFHSGVSHGGYMVLEDTADNIHVNIMKNMYSGETIHIHQK